MNHPIFSNHNLTQYLWLDIEDIKSLNIFFNTCTLRLNSGEKITVKAKELLPVMEKIRKERAKEIQIIDEGNSNFYKAYNPQTKNTYTLTPHHGYCECNCQDYQKVTNLIGEGDFQCKHGIALMDYLQIDFEFDNWRDLCDDFKINQQYEDYLDRQISMRW